MKQQDIFGLSLYMNEAASSQILLLNRLSLSMNEAPIKKTV